MSFRFITAVVLLIIACVLEFFCGGIGLFLNSVLAALIVFAFFFSFWELLPLVLLAVFLVNWQPAFSATILVFAVIPFAVLAFRRLFSLNPGAAMPAMMFCGLVIFYMVGVPRLSLFFLGMFLIDFVISLIFGELVFAALTKAEK